MDLSTWGLHDARSSIILMFPFLLYSQMSVSDAVGSRRDLLVQKATKSKLVLKVPLNSSCSSGTSWSCYKDTLKVPENRSCVFHEGSPHNDTHSFGGLEPQTPYVFKILNVANQECEVKTSTCPKSPPGVQDLHAQWVTPGRLDVRWSLPRETCESDLTYSVLHTAEETEHPSHWKQLKDEKRHPGISCPTKTCISFVDKIEEGKRLILKVQIRREGGDPDEVTATQVAVDGHWQKSEKQDVVWLEGILTAIGAALVLSIATITAVYCFDKRSRRQAEEARRDEEVASSYNPEAMVDELNWEYDPIILNEAAPEPTTPIASSPPPTTVDI